MEEEMAPENQAQGLRSEATTDDEETQLHQLEHKKEVARQQHHTVPSKQGEYGLPKEGNTDEFSSAGSGI